jgi:hypothetical protein
MTPVELTHLKYDIWAAADNLRANSDLNLLDAKAKDHFVIVDASASASRTKPTRAP